LLLKCKKIYHKFPARFRSVLSPIESIFRLACALRLDRWMITGEEISTKQELSILYAGRDENKNYFIKSVFGGACRESYMGKTGLWNILKILRRNDLEYSLIIAEIPKAFCTLFHKRKCFHIPCWLYGEIDISEDVCDFIKKYRSLKSDFNKIRKKKLDFEVTNDLDQFHNFYHNMYLPHISKSHGDCAVIQDYILMKKEFVNCDLLLIKNETEYIAGMLLVVQKNEARFWSLGIKDGNSDYVKDGAIGALIYFSIQYLQEKGYKKVSFGLCRAFLKDGALQFKKKRGLQIADKSKESFILKPVVKTEAIKGFFVNNPFILMEDMKLHGAVFIETDQLQIPKDIENIYKEYYLKGMSNLIVYQFGADPNKAQQIIPAELNDKITIRSAEAIF